MAGVKLSNFGGMIPAVDDRLLPDNMAAYAENAWLYQGTLTGLREPVLLHTCTTPNTKRVFRIPKQFVDKDHLPDSWWLEFAFKDVDVVRSPVVDDTYDRYYWATGATALEGQVPRYNTLARIANGDPAFKLGVPAPTVAPGVRMSPSGPMTAAAASYVLTSGTVQMIYGATSGQKTATFLAGSGTGALSGVDSAPIAETRAYVYTWVTAYGEEGPPSPPTVVTGLISDKWNITLTAPTSGDTTQRNLDKVRIYRTITSSQGVATYFLVTELPLATTSYIDTLADTVVSGNNELQSTTWTAPPDDLQGMVAMPNGMIVGFRENEIWFSEPYRPHAWPAQYTLVVDYKIVGVGAVGQTAVVCTQSATYAATGISPAVMTLSKISTREPCVSRGSILSTPQGVYYASPNGLVVAMAGQVVNATGKLFTKNKWQEAFNLPQLRSARFDTSYYAFGSVSNGVFQEDAFYNGAFELTNYTGADEGGIIDGDDSRTAFVKLTSDAPTMNIYNDPWTSEVLVLRDNKVYWIDVSDELPGQEFVWTSKRFQTPNKRNLEAMKVFFDNPENLANLGTIEIYADGRLAITRPMTQSGLVTRLPSGFKADYWQVKITSRVRVVSVELSPTVKELAGV